LLVDWHPGAFADSAGSRDGVSRASHAINILALGVRPHPGAR
jgi:hypothetical protein